jgi:hypothetical protein
MHTALWYKANASVQEDNSFLPQCQRQGFDPQQRPISLVQIQLVRYWTLLCSDRMALQNCLVRVGWKGEISHVQLHRSQTASKSLAGKFRILINSKPCQLCPQLRKPSCYNATLVACILWLQINNKSQRLIIANKTIGIEYVWLNHQQYNDCYMYVYITKTAVWKVISSLEQFRNVLCCQTCASLLFNAAVHDDIVSHLGAMSMK